MSRARRHNVHLTFKKRGGSFERYYHFILGCLVPLLGSLDGIEEVAQARRIYVRSCALFDPMLEEIELPSLRIVNPLAHKWMGSFLRRLPKSLPFRGFKIPGFDTAAAYDAEAFEKASEIMRSRLRGRIEAAAGALAWPDGSAGPTVLLIDRGAPDPHYLTAKAEVQGAGRSRRSIANVEALEEGLRGAGVNLRAETLEGRSLAFQIALFRSADIIIAQHGAALCNMIWARPTTALIEIFPEGDDITSLQNHFSELGRCLGFPYRRVKQPGKHGPVDVGLVVEATRQLLESRAA